MLIGRRLLLVEDNHRLAALYEAQLRAKGAEIMCVETGEAVLSSFQSFRPDLILLDIQLPDIDGFTVLDRLKESGHKTAVVVITAHGSVNYAVKAMRRGADDFLVKPFDQQRLVVTVRNALERHDLHAVVDRISRPIEDRFHDFVGTSTTMQTIYRTITAAASSSASIFITGESGTGKELCARAVHQESARSEASLIALNCGAIPRDLMESEIFGHRKGAFTGAISDRKGAASLAHGGTLFLDELGEMDIDLQTKLLRFVQTGTFMPVGTGREESVDVRFICATNRSPRDAIQAGRLREDLYYRLNVIQIHMPPLRERKEDIPPIAEAFLARFNKKEGKHFETFSPQGLELLMQYSWPGNVRELENMIRGLVVLNEGEQITEPMIAAVLGQRDDRVPEHGKNVLRNSIPTSANEPSQVIPLADVERAAIEQAMAQFDGNVALAAAALRVAPSTLYRKIQAWQRDAD